MKKILFCSAWLLMAFCLQTMAQAELKTWTYGGHTYTTEQRSVEIIRQPNQPLYQIFNCPSLYTQCKTIQGRWQGLE